MSENADRLWENATGAVKVQPKTESKPDSIIKKVVNKVADPKNATNFASSVNRLGKSLMNAGAEYGKAWASEEGAYSHYTKRHDSKDDNEPQNNKKNRKGFMDDEFCFSGPGMIDDQPCLFNNNVFNEEMFNNTIKHNVKK